MSDHPQADEPLDYGFRADLRETIRNLERINAEQRAEIEDLRISVIAFGAPTMVEDARLHGLPKGHLWPSDYDILARAGARMDDFVRHPTHYGEELATDG